MSFIKPESFSFDSQYEANHIGYNKTAATPVDLSIDTRWMPVYEILESLDFNGHKGLALLFCSEGCVAVKAAEVEERRHNVTALNVESLGGGKHFL